MIAVSQLLRGAVVGLVVICAFPLVTAGQSGQPEGMSVSDHVELDRLVDLAAARLGLNIEYEESSVKGSVTLRLASELSDDELWSLTNHLLSTHGFTTVRATPDETLSVVRIGDAANIARVEGVADLGEQPLLESTPQAGFVTVLARTRYQPAQELVQAVAPLIGPSGKVSLATGTDYLVVSGLTPKVESTLEVLTRFDMAGEGLVIERVEPENMPAESLQTAIKSMADRQAMLSGQTRIGDIMLSPDGRALLIVSPQSGLPYWRDLVERLDEREAVETSNYVPRHHAPSEVAQLIEQTIRGQGAAPGNDRFRVIVDELTGSLIITATAPEHVRIAELMSRLDQVPPEARRAVRRYTVRNRSADELVAVLSGLIDAGALSIAENARLSDERPNQIPGVTEMDVRQPTNLAAENQDDQMAGRTEVRDARESTVVGDSLSFTVDDATNTIIAIGDPRLLEQLGTLIEPLDVRQPQVRIEIVMVSLSEGDSLDLAVQLEKLFDLTDDTTLRLMSLFGLGLPAGAIGAGGAGSGFTGSVLNPGEFSAVVRALETVNEGRALSRPYLLVGNNQAATFDSVVEEPFVSVNASNTVATTSFGGAVPAGTVVSVTPTIASGDHLELEYSVSLSSFVGESSDPSIPPPRQDSSVSSVATIPDGYAVVVGGIESITEGEAVSQVPLLGDIPFIGELFKSQGKSRSRSRFFVFIRADVMRGTSFDALKYASDLALQDAGIDDGWPVVEPRIIR